jgi:hypothetical protein
MCAVKLGYIESTINDLRILDVEEKSYDPNAEITNMTTELY